MMHQGRPMGPQQSPQGPPRFPNQNQWNGPPRQNGPGIRQGMPNGPPGPPQHRPMVDILIHLIFLSVFVLFIYFHFIEHVGRRSVILV